MAAVDRARLESGLGHVGAAPADRGRLDLVVTRPEEEQRVLAESGRLDLEAGVAGDMWSWRPTSTTADGRPNPDAQVTVMSSRAAALVADSPEHADWAEAGDQLYVDLDLSADNLPPGTRLAIGGAVLEVTAAPHLGCGKFSRRFGVDALKVVNSETGRRMRLRGLNAKVVVAGEIAVGDEVTKLG